MTKRLCLLLCCCLFQHRIHAQDIILEKRATDAFPIVAPGGSACIIVDEPGDSLILKVAQLFQQDVAAVTGDKLSIHQRLQGGISKGLQYAISIDEQNPQVIIINKESDNLKTWSEWVANNIIIKSSTHHLMAPGKHTVKYWMISGGRRVTKTCSRLWGPAAKLPGPSGNEMEITYASATTATRH